LVNYYKEAKFIYYKLDDETLNEYNFIQNILDNELDKDTQLRYDYEILKAYKKANLNCDTVSQVKNVISQITK